MATQKVSDKNTNATVYVGLGKDFDNLIVQKSRPLLDIVRLGLELEELKLFDTFLARINSENPNISTVVFEKWNVIMTCSPEAKKYISINEHIWQFAQRHRFGGFCDTAS